MAQTVVCTERVGEENFLPKDAAQTLDTVLPSNTCRQHDTCVAGNRVRARAWCITNFNDVIQHPENALYDLMCEDYTKENKKHYHQYLYYKNAIAFNSIKKLYPTARIEKEKVQGAYIDYIKQNKNGRKKVVYEEGDAPRKNKFPTIKEVEQMSIEERKTLPIQYKNIVDKMNDRDVNDIDIEDWKKEVEIVWIMGPSGIGKTERAKQIVRDNASKYGTKVNVVKYTNTFWQGVGNAKIAIYDDFRDSHMHPSEFINFIDYNYHTINIKGGEKRNEYNLIIITSVQDPHFIYPGMKDNEPRYQWLRRMTIVDLTPPPADDDQASINEADIDIGSL